MIEVEAKAPAGPRTPERLREMGEAGAVEDHADAYFAHPQRSFADTDEALRLRRVGERVELTYKGPKIDAETKTRRELTVPVGDYDGACAILEALGFRRVAEVRKRRAHYRVGEWTATLDRVEGLAPYVEVERELPEGAPVDAAGSEALALLERLGAGPPERRSYLELLLEAEGRG